MTAYAIMDVDIFDIRKYMVFMHAVKPLIDSAGGRYLARGGEIRVYEGDYDPRRIVIIEFPSLVALDTFYESEAYQALKLVRDECSSSRLVAVEGLG